MAFVDAVASAARMVGHHHTYVWLVALLTAPQMARAVECQTCHGTAFLRFGNVLVPCRTCKGVGFVEVDDAVD